MVTLLFRRAEDQGDGVAQALPIGNFGFHLSAALLGERVELGFASGLGFFPFGLQPASVFQTMKRGIEGALMDLEEVLRDLLKALRDSVAVAGAQSDNLQNQEIQRSSEEL